MYWRIPHLALESGRQDRRAPMKLTFLGTGGGRFVVIKQIRATGGFVLELGDRVMHVDPGPGALVRAREFKLNISRANTLLISHHHQDHFNDAVFLVEAMTKGATEKAGLLAAPESIVNGKGDYLPAIDKMHREVLERIEIMTKGKTIQAGSVTITATPTKHRDKDGVGYVFEGEGLKIGYTGDGDFFPDMSRHFQGCDYLIINVLRPRTDTWPMHMNSRGAVKLIKSTKPKQAIIQHFGMKMMKGVAQKEAEWIEKQTGIKTIAARDGFAVTHGKGTGKQESTTLEKYLDQDGD
jgi:phosphoribosyl 1,2-cyclic phosphodiesterase